jgi:predicted GIY-YIG superfamily endonuclease
MVYIGETTNVSQRFDGHNRDKDFWQTAVILTSRTETFTASHGKYLEWLSIKTAREANRYLVEQNSQNKPHVPEPMEQELLEVFETASILLGALGFPVFEPLVKESERKDADIFYCQGPDAQASGQLVDDGFVVFKGSKGRKAAVASSQRWRWLGTLRQPLIEQGILKEDGNHYVFTEDFLFGSPSAASVVVLARTSNGWRDWRTKDGKTLNEIKRAGL